MNILFICDEYPPGLNGGIGSITQSLARAMVRQGHHVFVAGLYTTSYGGKDYEDDHGVAVWRLRYNKSLHGSSLLHKIRRNMPHFIHSKLQAYKNYKTFINFVQDLISKKNIDIVEMPDWNTYIYDIGIRTPFPMFKVPLVLKFHCSLSYLTVEMGKTPRKKWYDIDRAIFERADARVAVSNYTAIQTNKLFDTHEKIKTLYNCIDPVKAPSIIKRLDKLVFFAGTLAVNKGVFSLIKAWNLVAKKDEEARLVIFGKGDDKALKDLLDQEARHSVTFMGHQPRQELLTMLESACLAVYPSYSEAFSMAPLESMSRGCPTIFTERSSGREVITDGITGLLVDPDDVNQIAEKILLLLGNEDLRLKIGHAGKESIEKKFNLDHSVTEHIEFYQAVIRDFNPLTKIL